MSMISAQIDELRELAGDGSMEWVAGPIRASVLRDAADTIWQLRDDLQRTHGLLDEAEHDESMAWDRVRKAEAEADRLRDELESVGTAAYLYGRSDLKAENAKLREEIEAAKHDLQVFSANLARLGAENTKLREVMAE